MTSIIFNVISVNIIRRNYIKSLLKANNIPFKIWKCKPHKTPAFGLFLNTIKLYQYAQKNNLPYIAILEDNIRIHESYTPDMFREIEQFILTPDWNQLFLGGGMNLHGNRVSNYKNRIYKTFTNHGTAAYIINAKHYNSILKDPKTKEIFRNYKKHGSYVPIDIFLQSYSDRYLHKPFIFPRSNAIKSTINGHLDLFRLVYFHPIVFRICEELLFRNIPILEFPVLFIIIVLAIVAVIYVVIKII